MRARYQQMQQQRQQKLSEIGKKLNYIKSFSAQPQNGNSQSANVSTASVPASSSINTSGSSNMSGASQGSAANTSGAAGSLQCSPSRTPREPSVSTSSSFLSTSSSRVLSKQPEHIQNTSKSASKHDLDTTQPGLDEKGPSSRPSLMASSIAAPLPVEAPAERVPTISAEDTFDSVRPLGGKRVSSFPPRRVSSLPPRASPPTFENLPPCPAINSAQAPAPVATATPAAAAAPATALPISSDQVESTPAVVPQRPVAAKKQKPIEKKLPTDKHERAKLNRIKQQKVSFFLRCGFGSIRLMFFPQELQAERLRKQQELELKRKKAEEKRKQGELDKKTQGKYAKSIKPRPVNTTINDKSTEVVKKPSKKIAVQVANTKQIQKAKTKAKAVMSPPAPRAKGSQLPTPGNTVSVSPFFIFTHCLCLCWRSRVSANAFYFLPEKRIQE